jgi:hypothetical protein
MFSIPENSRRKKIGLIKLSIFTKPNTYIFAIVLCVMTVFLGKKSNYDNSKNLDGFTKCKLKKKENKLKKQTNKKKKKEKKTHIKSPETC